MSTPNLKKVLIIPAAALLIWLAARYLLPIFMPFLLAALLALAAEPLVGFFHMRARLSRTVSTGIGVTVTLGVMTLLVMVLGALLLRQMQALVGVIPDLEGAAQDGLSSLQQWLLDIANGSPAAIRPIATHSVQALFDNSSNLVDRISAWVLGLASGILSKLPDSALGLGTWLLASYMISAKLPQIRDALTQKLPQTWHRQVKPMLQRLRKSVSGWLTAQLKLTAITFLVLASGFFLLRFSHGMVWAAVISLLDALPILGSGMVLIPWSIVCFIQGDTIRAIGLLGVYAAAALLRSVLEPKLVGKQLGLDPLLTLAAMYAGYRLFGFGGLILAPLLTVTAVQLFQTPADP